MLHGFGNPDQEDLPVNGLLPELRRRQLIDTDYVGEDFRSNLDLPPLASPTAIQTPNGLTASRSQLRTQIALTRRQRL
ncbi:MULTISPECIES: hypothetical protein [Rhizobium]|uniref:hypothetical protein n=1 Tax=Rhizobium TaxID=379 RepID=UPI0021B14EAD|nr:MULTISPECIES: hypothetical protein [Rhizobium]